MVLSYRWPPATHAVSPPEELDQTGTFSQLWGRIRTLREMQPSARAHSLLAKEVCLLLALPQVRRLLSALQGKTILSAAECFQN